MTNILNLALAMAAGVFLGLIFFGGLWWTVRRGLTSTSPALWFIASTLLRLGIVLAGFFFVAGGDWQRLLAALAGFVIARLAVLRITRPAPTSASWAQERNHAP